MRLAIVNPTNGDLSGGYRKYLQRIVPLIQNHPDINEIRVYVPPQMSGYFCKDAPSLLSWPDGDHKRGFPWIKKQTRKGPPDIVFIPTARYVDFGSIPTVIMVRNMEPMCTPFGKNPLLESIKNIGRALSAKKASRRAARTIAVSKHVKNFLTTQWMIEPDRVGIVYHGVDLPNDSAPLNISDHLKSLQNEKIIFTAGSIRPARGLEDLLQSFRLIYSSAPNVKLVIAGSIDPGMGAFKSKLDNMIAKLGISPGVIWEGSLSEKDMSWCYRNCTVFVMTSRAEACPNIVLEAMAHRCISVSTETPPMPEFFADSALYYPPKDFTTLARQIQTALSMDQTERAAMSSAAKDIASRFTWRSCAQKTVDELQKALQ